MSVHAELHTPCRAWFTRLMGIFLLALLAACGGGNADGVTAASTPAPVAETAPGDETPVPGAPAAPATPAPADTPVAAPGSSVTASETAPLSVNESAAAIDASWTQCAKEGQTCSFSGSKQVRYGTATRYFTKTVTGPVSCTNAVFGDPWVGVSKACWIPAATTASAPAPTTTTATSTPVACAIEGGTCSFSGTRSVRYGTQTTYFTKTLAGPVSCTNAVFGDPLPGTRKACWTLEAATATTTTTTTPSAPATSTTTSPTPVAQPVATTPVPTPDPEAALSAGAAEEFVGPFASWANAKRDFGAKGDGVTDDTAALQAALDSLGAGGKPHVLYLPAGTYKLSNTLRMTGRAGMGIIGQDPASTTLRWAGARGGSLLSTNAVGWMRVHRITFDGAGTAGTGVDQDWDRNQSVNYYAGHWEYADTVFKDMEFGIRGGRSDYPSAETVIKRSRFYRISQAGVRVENFNALNWFVVNSYFEDCRTGVTNHPGAGDFRVYDSVFRRSTFADVSISNFGFFGIRRNTSIGSRQFFNAAGVAGYGVQINLQDNVVLDTQTTAVDIGNRGPLMMVDNVFRSAAGQGGPAVALTSYGDGAVLSMGNKFTVANPIQVSTQVKLRRVDDSTVSRDSINPTVPGPAPFAPVASRRIFEVPAGANGSTIQQAIDAAVQSGTVRPVVHLAPGDFPVASTLNVPANSDVQIIGDDTRFGYMGSRLMWNGPSGGTVLKLAGPSRATLRSLSVVGNGRFPAVGIAVQNADQAGARIYGDQLDHFEMPANSRALVGDGLDNALVQMQTMWSGNGSTEEYVVATMIGGPRTAAGEATAAKMNIFGAWSSCGPAFAVLGNGKLMAHDMHFEAWNRRYIDLGSAHSGTLTVHGGKAFADSGRSTTPLISVNGFKGKFTFLSHVMFDNASIAVNSLAAQSKVLASGLGFLANGTLTSRVAAEQATLLFNQRRTGTGDIALPDSGVSDDATLRAMFAHTRAEKPQSVKPLPAGVTDVRFYRVAVTQSTTGVRITRD